MPFYKYINEAGEVKELFQNIVDMKDEIEIDGSVFKRVPEFCSNFVLKGMGWASKTPSNSLGDPQHFTEVGIKVDYDKKRQMKEAGEKV